jgi:SOS response regulatory protein OraA/RecX
MSHHSEKTTERALLDNSSNDLAKARNYLLRILTRRDYPRHQLENKLKKFSLTAVEIKQVIDELIEDGLFKKDSYKMGRSRELLKKGFGKRVIEQKLKVVKESLAPSELTTLCEDLEITSQNQIRQLIEKLLSKESSASLEPQKRKQRIINFLVRKGHNFNEIFSELKNYKI